jgi:predicted Zn-dependent peptidase
MRYITIGQFIHIFLDPRDRNTTSMEFIYSAGGSVYETEVDRGRMHLMEHCICSRTKDMTFKEFKDFTFRESITYNAYTSANVLALEASGHKDDFTKIFDFLFEMFTEPTFDQEGLDREREIVLREITDRKGSPNYKLYYDYSNHFYTENSITRHEVLGDSEVVEATQLDDFKRLHKNALNQSNLLFFINGGGVDEEYLLKKINNFLNSDSGKQFTDSQKKLFPAHNINEFKNQTNETFVHEFAHEECELTINIPLSINFSNRAVRDVFASLFLRWNGSGLYDLLRDKKGLIYGYNFYFDRETQVLNIEMNCSLENIHTIISHTREFFENFITSFDELKFNQLKHQLIKKQDLSNDVLGNESEFAYNTLKNYREIEDFESFRKKLDAVRKEDVLAVFEEVKTHLKTAKIILSSRNKEITSYLAKL